MRQIHLPPRDPAQDIQFSLSELRREVRELSAHKSAALAPQVESAPSAPSGIGRDYPIVLHYEFDPQPATLSASPANSTEHLPHRESAGAASASDRPKHLPSPSRQVPAPDRVESERAPRRSGPPAFGGGMPDPMALQFSIQRNQQALVGCLEAVRRGFAQFEMQFIRLERELQQLSRRFDNRL